MKLDLSPAAVDTLNLALQAMLVTANSTIAELRTAVNTAQLAQREEARAAAEKVQKAAAKLAARGKNGAAEAPKPPTGAAA